MVRILNGFDLPGAANDDLVQRKSGVFVPRTMAQVKTDLALVKGDVGLGSVDNTSDAAKPISTLTQAALNTKVETVGGFGAIHVGPGGSLNLTVTADDANSGQSGFLSSAGFDKLAATPLNNRTATTAPTINDDSADGYVVGSHWLNVTLDIAYICLDSTVGAAVWNRIQIWDADLDTIAGLTPTTDNFMQSKSSAWASRTIAQVKTDLGIPAGTVWTSGNDGTGSGLDADLFDGLNSDGFPFGINGFATSSMTDFNAITKTGTYYGFAMSNMPAGMSGGYCIHSQHNTSASYASQLALDVFGAPAAAGSLRIWARIKEGGTWGAWRQIAGSVTWTVPTYSGNWADYGVGNSLAGWRVDGHDRVILKGLAKNTAGFSGTSTILTLPVGSRPTLSHTFAAMSSVGPLQMDITSGGIVQVTYGASAPANTWVSLAGFGFDIGT